MSQLSEFVQDAFRDASNTIGTKNLTIEGGKPVIVVNGESTYSRDWEQSGFDSEATLRVVCSSDDFKSNYPSLAKSYQGKSCKINSEIWKVGTLEVGDEFMTINLVSIHESA